METQADRDEYVYRCELAGSDALTPLFSPLTIRGLRLPNRFVMAPMTRSFSPLGVPPPETAPYYRRRAEGGTGLLVTEGIAIPHESAIGLSGVDVPNIPRLLGAEALAAWRHVVDEVHAGGGLIAPQLWHQGPMRAPFTGPNPEAKSLRPSGIWGPMGGTSLVGPDYIGTVSNPIEPMTDGEIADVIAAYGRAAAGAKALGFDAIAVHGAHGYLIDSFLWAGTNRRTDRWGGDIAARSEFAAETVRVIRATVGETVPIFFRFSQWKLQDSGARLANTPAELEQMLAPIAAAGVDVFEVSERCFDTPAFTGSDLCLAGWTRRVSGRLTMAVGNVSLSKGLFESRGAGSDFADNLGALVRRFERQEFDLVAVGRMLIANPDWVRRVRLGQPLRAFNRSLLATLS
jgi:2,4-dienoyl-CoA reductase-like NADH-dependent reductase (Old Yellow Enzyme family)